MGNFSEFEKTYLASKVIYNDNSPDLPESTPQSVRDLYMGYGLSSFKNGFLWIIDPISYKDDYLPWFKNIESQQGYIEADKTFPFLRTAFGDVVFFCGKQLGFISISTGVTNYLSMNFYLNVSLTEKETLRDLYLFEMFKNFSSEEKIGSEECLGFLPPLALGGELDEENIQKVGLREHLAFLSQFIEETKDAVDSL